MKASVAIITNNQFYIIVFIVLVTYLTSHILKPFIPFLSSDICWSEAQISFAFLRSTKALGQWSAVYIKLVIKCQFLVLFNVSECKNTYANLSKNIPFLSNTVWFARVIYETCQISLISRVNNFTFGCLHEVSAG